MNDQEAQDFGISTDHEVVLGAGALGDGVVHLRRRPAPEADAEPVDYASK